MTKPTKRPAKKRASPATRLQAGEVCGQLEQVQVEHQQQPPAVSSARTIHPRRPAPPVPRGKPVPNHTPSPPVDLEDNDR